MATKTKAVLAPHVGQIIRLIRGARVILDADLAILYGVETKRLNQQVRRNIERFPADFMFQLTRKDVDNLRLQIATSSRTHGGRRHAIFAFTEQGVAMLSSVLNSSEAVRVNIEIMRAFVRLRRALADHVELSARLDALEKKYDRRFRAVFDAIRSMMREPSRTRARIGFRPPPSRPLSTP
jgi:hypothetical protein